MKTTPQKKPKHKQIAILTEAAAAVLDAIEAQPSPTVALTTAAAFLRNVLNRNGGRPRDSTKAALIDSLVRDGKTIREIYKQTGIAESTIYRHLGRAKETQ